MGARPGGHQFPPGSPLPLAFPTIPLAHSRMTPTLPAIAQKNGQNREIELQSAFEILTLYVYHLCANRPGDLLASHATVSVACATVALPGVADVSFYGANADRGPSVSHSIGLIYLCEKSVVVPDFGEAHGRGSSRCFSARNRLEFALALKLRQLMIPAASVAAIMYVLRAFESKVAREIPTSRLPQSLLEPGAPECRLIISSNGQCLFFALRRKGGATRLYGGLDLAALTPSKKKDYR